MTERSFPLPSELTAVPGAEGWEAMYPYFSRFQPEDDQRFWFYNSMHFPEVVPAFDGLTSEIPYTAIGANTARLFSFPTTMGIEYRIVNGRVYITANPVLDEAEQGKRFADFQERAGHYYGNWDRLYGEWQQRIEALIAEIEAVEVPELGDLDPIEVITSGRGFASNHFLRENFHRCIDLYSKMWHHHTEFLMLGYGAYVVFFEFCKQAFPEMGDQMVARMVAGMDVTMYRPDDELKKLAALAVELDLGDLFVEGAEPAKVLSSLGERGEAGARWLAALEAAKDPWFNVSMVSWVMPHSIFTAGSFRASGTAPSAGGGDQPDSASTMRLRSATTGCQCRAPSSVPPDAQASMTSASASSTSTCRRWKTSSASSSTPRCASSAPKARIFWKKRVVNQCSQ
jgi:pyruvate,water dikinase